MVLSSPQSGGSKKVQLVHRDLEIRKGDERGERGGITPGLGFEVWGLRCDFIDQGFRV